MPFGDEGLEDGIALALSGGGFRAALFHVGALLRINELRLLPSLRRVSSVSGGSITAGRLAVCWKSLKFDEDQYCSNLVEKFVEPVRAFCTRHVDALAIGEGALVPWKNAADVVMELYDEHLFEGQTLQDLPDEPRFVFNSTNFQTGKSFRFSKPYAGDYLIDLIEKPAYAVSLAVTCSSAFPPFLSPFELKVEPGALKPQKGAHLNDDPVFTRKLLLTDGGVYDNLGLETVWNRYKTLLVSDGGSPFKPEPKMSDAWAAQAMRAFDIVTDQCRGLRKRKLVGDLESKQRTGAFWGIDTDPRGYKAPGSLEVSDAKRQELAGMRTRLNHFNEREQCELINWGYAVSDMAIRSYYTANGAAPAWPYAEYRLNI